MLYLFRKHKASLLIKIALFAIVIVFVFWGAYTAKMGKSGKIALIDDTHYVDTAEYNQMYQQLLESYRNQFGKSVTEEQISKLDLKSRALQTLVEQYILITAADSLGLVAGTEEIQQKILGNPAFQVDGKFDKNSYRLVLQRNRMTPEIFESRLSKDLSIQKVEEYIRRQAVVTEEDILSDYRFNNTQVQLGYAIFDPKTYEDRVKPEEKDLQAFYEAHQGDYKDPARRQAVYVLFNTADFMDKATVSEADVRRQYDQNRKDYHHAKEVKASHILFTLKEGAPEEEVLKVKEQAEAVLAEVRKGGDFKELARKHSQDPSAVRNSGDLGYFTKDRMVPSFADAAFAMNPGEVGDLVRTPFGFHIIKVEDVKPETTESFEQVKAAIETSLKEQEAREMAYKKAKEFDDVAYSTRDLAKAAEKANFKILGADAWFTQSEIPTGLDADPKGSDFVKKLFALNENAYSGVIELGSGYVVGQLKGVRTPQVLPFESARELVLKDFRTERSREMARQEATALLDAARKAGGLEAAVKGLKVEYRKSDWFSRKEPDRELKGVFGTVAARVFELDAQNPYPAEPLEFGSRVLICQLLDKRLSEENLPKERAAIEKKLLTQKQGAMWQTWLNARLAQTKIEQLNEL